MKQTTSPACNRDCVVNFLPGEGLADWLLDLLDRCNARDSLALASPGGLSFMQSLVEFASLIVFPSKHSDID